MQTITGEHETNEKRQKRYRCTGSECQGYDPGGSLHKCNRAQLKHLISAAIMYELIYSMCTSS